ncbi:AAA family ATPase [Paenibacillus pinistramenti]|uniref:AAA family ATPase n=1 Tax=Paenibacillus pinistramenti TaxID=1768003 RepID=UPI001107E808|nr:AAA family ATPase [Paenibacillus pinistramenti]
MKPILLKLAGLQSYRESQEIDFTQLCETGLFGIFGPTGSGKSTLLDAMTLALYGKVERAVNGTQGIMNHSEDSLFVAFTFELVSPKGSQRYRVERRFKRTGDQSVSCTISRFIEIKADGETVVADKLAEVNRCVEDKIGLKMDDFTRAVVLPQGKFSEFLSLKGSERRQMLQRLFHLEKYGDQLSAKLSRRIKDTESRLKELLAEQQGLGMASEESVKAAEDRLKETAEAAASAREELKEARSHAEEGAKVRELLHEQRRQNEEAAKLALRNPEAEAAENRLRHAEAAGRLHPVLTAWKESAALAGARALEAEAAAVRALAAEQQAAEAAHKSALAAEALETEEPGLLRRLEQLEQAKVLQQEVEQLGAELAQQQAKKQELEQQRGGSAEEYAKEEALLNKAVQRRKELELQLKEKEVKSDERRLLQEGMQRKEGLAAAAGQLEQARSEADAQRRKHEESAGLLGQLTVKLQHSEAEREALLGEAAQLAAELKQQEQELLSCGEALEKREAALRSRLKEQELHVWSVRLAQGLEDGCGCPVCGSLSHPSPASHGEGETAALEAELQALALLLPECRELHFGTARDLESVRAVLESLDAALQAAASGEAAAALEPAAAVPGAPLDAESARGRLAALRSKRGESGARLAALQSRARDQRSAGAELRQRCAHAAAEEAAAKGQLEQLEARCSALGADLQRRSAEWAAAHPGVTPDELQLSYDALHAKDVQADDIRHRLEVSGPYIEDKTGRLRSLSERLAALDKELVECATRLEGSRQLLEEKAVRLQGLTQGEPAGRLLEAAESRLQQLRASAKEAREGFAAAEQLRNETAKADVLARQAAAAAAKEAEAREKTWQKELAESPFAGENEAAAAMMDAKEAEQLEQWVLHHRRQQQELAVTLRDLEARLGGRTLTEEEWTAVEQRFSECQTRDELALQENAKAQRDLEDVEKRHVRWLELEGIRSGLEQEAGMLGKLQSSLRGNAFVEYVAEEQLMQVSQAASQRLRFLTKQRYSLETDSGGGFVIRDDANGGVKRPVSTLSGGETFLTSLALALALSAQIQLRGQYPLQFFFLDEGFGTLDPELLDTVITSLEHLHHDHLSVGVISHVAELRERLPRKLIVEPAEHAGEGSRIRLEKL